MEAFVCNKLIYRCNKNAILLIFMSPLAKPGRNNLENIYCMNVQIEGMCYNSYARNEVITAQFIRNFFAICLISQG